MSLHAISAIKNIAFTILKKQILLNTASPKKKKSKKSIYIDWVKKWLSYTESDTTNIQNHWSLLFLGGQTQHLYQF